MENTNKKTFMTKTSWRIYKKNKSVVNSMCAALTVLGLMFATAAQAELPTGGNVVGGAASIGVVGNNMNINQGTQNAIIDWGSFNIGRENAVNINNGTGSTLNRVTGSGISNINGVLNATGSAYLINRNGVVVGSQGVINTGGSAVLSTQDISNNDFMSGKQTNFVSAPSNAQVINNGTIVAGKNAIIVSGALQNAGSITGENVELTAKNGNPYAVAINNTGTVRATGLQNVGGRLVLSAGNSAVQNSGVLDASNAGNGGTVTVTGSDVRLTPASMIKANGGVNGGNVNIGGGYQGKDASIQNAQNTTLEYGSKIEASGTNGNGGQVVIWSDKKTDFNGAIKATGKVDGGKVEVSSKDELILTSWDYDIKGETGKGGELLFDPRNINVVDGAKSSNSALEIAIKNTIKDADIEWQLNNGATVQIQTGDLGDTVGTDEGDITFANNVSIVWNKPGAILFLIAHRDINLAGNIDASSAPSGAPIEVNAGRNINIASNTILKTGTTGLLNLNAAANVGAWFGANGDKNSDIVSNWKTGTGAITHGNNVTLQGATIVLKSGKAVDGTRTDIDSNIAFNSPTDAGFSEFQLLGFDDVNVNSNNNSTLETTGGTLAIVAKNIVVDEDVYGKGGLYLSAAAFDNTTNNFIGLDATDPNNSITTGVNAGRDDLRSDGWKTQQGTVTFNGSNLLKICCGLTITSGLDGSGNRTNLSSVNATFDYNNDYDIVNWFEVKGFNNFDTTIAGNILNSNSFIDIRNKNNVINYSLVAGKDIPAGEAADQYGYVRVMGGVFNSSNTYSDNIENAGTTTFDNSLIDGPLVISAAKGVTLTSGTNSLTGRTSITDETDTSPTGTAYAGRTDNVKFAHTDNNGQYDGNVRIEGFSTIALDTSGIGGELKATGNINTWSSDLTNINDNLTASNILSISENDIFLRNNSTLTASNEAILVVDEKDKFRTSFGSGEGRLVTEANTNINAGRVALFTSRQPINTIDGQINSQGFTAGLEFQGTAKEVWKSFYSNNNRFSRNPYVVYYKNDGVPQIVFSKPDCASNPDASGCESFVQQPDDKREYRINLTQTESNVGEPTLVQGNSSDIRNTEYFVTSSPTYVDYRLLTAEKLKDFATAFPLQVVGTTLQGLNVIPGFGGVALAINGVVGGITDVVTGGKR